MRYGNEHVRIHDTSFVPARVIRPSFVNLSELLRRFFKYLKKSGPYPPYNYWTDCFGNSYRKHTLSSIFFLYWRIRGVSNSLMLNSDFERLTFLLQFDIQAHHLLILRVVWLRSAYPVKFNPQFHAAFQYRNRSFRQNRWLIQWCPKLMRNIRYKLIL